MKSGPGRPARKVSASGPKVGLSATPHGPGRSKGWTPDWHEGEFWPAWIRWRKLNIDKVIEAPTGTHYENGVWEEHPDLSKVDEVGFTDQLHFQRVDREGLRHASDDGMKTSIPRRKTFLLHGWRGDVAAPLAVIHQAKPEARRNLEAFLGEAFQELLSIIDSFPYQCSRIHCITPSTLSVIASYSAWASGCAVCS